MSTRLVILGLLKEKPLYGYELKHIIENHMGDWTSIAFGSIYFALKKLTEEGLVKELGVEKTGNRPTRRVYEVTDSGQFEFSRLLEELWRSEDRKYYPLDIGLFFLAELPPEMSLLLIRGRIEGLSSGLKHLNGHEKVIRNNPNVPPQAHAIFSHSRYHLEAELAWMKEVEEGVVSGILP